MANMSDILMSKLESISWLYSINCQIHGRNTTLLLKYIIEDDFYAVMITDMTLTYFECLEGQQIDEHYKRFNKGEIKRERLLIHLNSILKDITKAKLWRFEVLLVDCHTSRLTLKVQNQLSILKFEWSFYMISTNPETLSRHLTIPFMKLITSLRTGIHLLQKEIKNKDKQLEQLDQNHSNTDTHSDNDLYEETFINNIISSNSLITNSATDDNSLLINHLFEDKIVNSLLIDLHNTEKNAVTDSSNQSLINSQNIVIDNKIDQNIIEEEMSKTREIDPKIKRDERKEPTMRTNKKPKL